MNFFRDQWEEQMALFSGWCVNLSGMSIADVDAREISIRLDKDNTIQHLFLGGNNIGDYGITALATSLARNKTLKSLNLAGNLFSDVGATEIANALRRNTSLESIILFGTPIEEQGCREIAAALRSNTTLKTVNLGKTGMSNDVAKSCVSLCRQKIASWYSIKKGWFGLTPLDGSQPQPQSWDYLYCQSMCLIIIIEENERVEDEVLEEMRLLESEIFTINPYCRDVSTDM